MSVVGELVATGSAFEDDACSVDLGFGDMAEWDDKSVVDGTAAQGDEDCGVKELLCIICRKNPRAENNRNKVLLQSLLHLGREGSRT